MLKRIRNISIGLALVAISIAIGYRFGYKEGIVANDGQSDLDLSLMWRVKNVLETKFLEKDKLDDNKMVYGAISGLVSSLGDPYTVFLPPKENKSSNEDLAGEFGGVGIQLGYKDKNLAVMAPLPNTPASKAGLKAGDLILKITDKEKKIDQDTAGIALDRAVELIRGKEGSEVVLKIYREEKKVTEDVTLQREIIVVASLELEFKKSEGKTVAWVKLYKFSEQLYKDWPELVNKIIEQKSKLGADFGGIVLDLRNNPGGFLQGSVVVASDFIKEGVVVKQKNSDGTEEKYEVEKDKGRLLEDKLVVLVNGGSASAAEILAGALKEYDRAILVGEKTFGKGTVQSPEDFADGSGLHVTIAKWLLPSGKNIHGEGVMPEVEVKVTETDKEDLQLKKAIEEVLN